MQRVALGMLGEPAAAGIARTSSRAEELGFHSVWLSETRFTRDAITVAAAVGLATKRLQVATGVINPFTRGAVLTAATVATLDELTEGRAILGIGPGSPLILERQGYAFDRPLQRLREYVEVVRRLLTGETVDYQGEIVHVHGAKLDFRPARASVPIYLGVTGPRALELAGEIGDGVLLNGFISVAYTGRAIERVRAGAARAGRDPGEIDIASNMMVSIDDDSRRAKEAARPLVTTYLASFPNIARESSIPESELSEIRNAFLSGNTAEAMRRVTDGMVDELTCSGTPDDCRACVQERRAAGVAMPVFFVLGDADRVLRELARA